MSSISDTHSPLLPSLLAPQGLQARGFKGRKSLPTRMATPADLATAGSTKATGSELTMLLQQLQKNVLQDKHTLTGTGRYVLVGWGEEKGMGGQRVYDCFIH